MRMEVKKSRMFSPMIKGKYAIHLCSVVVGEVWRCGREEELTVGNEGV